MDPYGWPVAFLLTLALEAPVYVVALRRAFGAWGALILALAVNAATHPAAWSAIMAAPSPPRFVAVEACVAVVEAALVVAAGRSRFARRRVGVREAVAIALAANGLSAGVGLLL